MRNALYPVSAVVLEEKLSGAVLVTNQASGEKFALSGKLASEMLALIQQGHCGIVLQALGQDHPLVKLGQRLAQEQPLPVTPRSILEQDGFDTLFVELTGQCNARCQHCYANASPEIKPALTREVCFTILTEAKRLGFRRIQLTGGEALLCPFIVDLVAAISQQKMTCEIYTNGILLRDALLDQLLPYQPRFAFSFYSYQADTHDLITQTPGSWVRTWSAIKRVQKHGLRLRVSIIVTAHNANDVTTTVAWLKQHEVHDVAVAAARAVGRGTAFVEPVEYVNRQEKNPYPTYKRGRLCVSYDGSVLPCIFNRTDSLGNVYERSLHDIIHDPILPKITHDCQQTGEADSADKLACANCRLTAYALRAIQNEM